MNLNVRIESLYYLSEQLRDLDTPKLIEIFHKAEIENPWFTQLNIRNAVSAIRDQYLTQKAITHLVSKYSLDNHIAPKKIGLIMAGNIPLVGFHDLLCCYLTGHYCLMKYSDKDTILMKYVVQTIIEKYPEAAIYFQQVEKLTDYDAAIATGSNSTSKHFEYYFRHVPHIIRQNRNSIAVLTGDESELALQRLGSDIFSYFGLGCRNVSKIFIPQGFDITRLFVPFDKHKSLIHHNKYKNNYDYNVALNLLNQEDFLQNELLIFKKAEPIISRIGSVHYEFYNDIRDLSLWIEDHQSEIQCVVSEKDIPGLETIPFGEAQCPAIDTFADGVDTIQFLLTI